MTKTCSRCKEVMDKSLFNRNRSYPDGLQSQCKRCQLSSNRESSERHPETRRAALKKQDTGRNRQSDAVKHRAQLRLQRAVKSGKLIRPTICEACFSSTSEIQAHHDDYSAPLSVRWLCARCHGRLHAEMRAA